jgi:murein L,D-transpeptidase YafK
MYYILFLLIMLQPTPFKQKQLKNARVKLAFEEKENVVKKLFSEKQLPYSGFHLFIRAFKKEQLLEVWIKEPSQEKYVLLNAYEFCSSSGTLGPKRKEGDLQIPEGIYSINHFNPLSSFHLSLGINYPNRSDKILGDSKHPGSAIYIHGNCVTVGCIPITDNKIKELYLLAVEARNNSQKEIAVHIFPSKMDNQSMMALRNLAPQHTGFWNNLQDIYNDFENNKTLREVSVNNSGEYFIK